EMKDALELAYQTEETVAQRVAGNANISGDKLDSIKTLKDLLPNLAMSEMSVAEATNNYAAALMAADYAGRELNEEEKLAILNHFRNKAGLDNARVSTQGFGEASEGAAEGVKTLNEQINELTGLTDEDFIGGLKGAMDQTMSDAYAEADRIMAEQHQSELDAIAAAGEEKLNQLERDGEAKEAEFDAR